MSWSTCYSGSNNIHFSYPPLMSDGRNYASWQPGNQINNKIKQQNNIRTNSEYRKFLIENANNIIKLNEKEACNNCGCCPYYNNSEISNVPYLYQSCNSTNQPVGYQNSDLKNLYLSREQLAIIKSQPISIQIK